MTNTPTPTPNPTQPIPTQRKRLLKWVTLALVATSIIYGLLSLTNRPSQPPGWDATTEPIFSGVLGDITGTILNRVISITSSSLFDETKTFHTVTQEDVRWITSSKYLQRLFILKCDLSKVDINGLDRLNDLEFIYLLDTRVSGKQLKQIASTPNLQSLRIALDYTQYRAKENAYDNLQQPHTPTQPTITFPPDGLQHLSNIKALGAFGLSSAKVNDNDFKHITKWTNLHTLEIRACSISGDALQYIALLQNLNTLDLRDNPIQDQTLDHLAGHKKLEELYLSQTPIGDRALKPISTLPNLERLRLNNTQVTGQGLAYLATMPRLDTLELQNTAVSDEGLAYLISLPNLFHLNLKNTQITDQGLIHLTKMKNLGGVNLSNTAITPAGLLTLAKIPDLQSITLDDEFKQKHAKAIEEFIYSHNINIY